MGPLERSFTMKSIINKLKKQFHTKTFHYGSFSILLTAVVLIIAILVNVAVNALPTSLIQIDMSSSRIFTLNEQSVNVLKNLDQDVTIYPLFETGQEDETLMKLLDRYTEQSDHIKVETVDPVANPSFTSGYNASSLQTGSVIVESGNRYKTIQSYEIYETSYDSCYSSEQYFDGEGELTSAIDYVTSESLPNIYYTTGHDELSISTAFESALTKSNYALTELSLLSAGSVPEDCDVLMILSPQSDFSAAEADMVIQYLESGKKAYIQTSYLSGNFTEFSRILSNYGIQSSSGIILEGDSDYSYQENGSFLPYIMPQLQSHTITDDFIGSKKPALISLASALELTDVRSSVSRTTLMTTSESGYEKTMVNGKLSTAEKEDGDRTGTFNLGVLAEEETASGETTQLVVYSTPYLTDDSLVNYYNISNLDLAVNSIGYLCEHESTITIDAKSMMLETITPSTAAVNIQTIVFIVLLPLSVLISGIVIWVRRRRK